MEDFSSPDVYSSDNFLWWAGISLVQEEPSDAGRFRQQDLVQRECRPGSICGLLIASDEPDDNDTASNCKGLCTSVENVSAHVLVAYVDSTRVLPFQD